MSTATAIRKRLFNPPNGRHSSETLIVSQAIWLRQQAQKIDEVEREAAQARTEAEMSRLKREWEAALNAVKDAERDAVKSEIEFIRATTINSVPLKSIVMAVSSHYKIRISDMISERRSKDIVTARHMAMFIARHRTPRSLPKIGKVLGDRDHTTVLHGVRKMTYRLTKEVKLRGDLAAICVVLGIEYPGVSDQSGRGEEVV